MKLVVRVDVSARIGTGHWRRMSNLVASWPEAEAVYLVRTDDPANKLFAGTSVRFLPDDAGLPVLARIGEEEQPALWLVDLLRYSPDDIRQLKEATKSRVASFHEYRDWAGASDLAVNYNLFDGFEEAGSERLLAGPKYCILNQEILKLRRSTATREVLVTFGGSDPSRFVDRFLEKVASRLPRIPFVIHSGPFVVSSGAAKGIALSNHVRFTTPADSFFDLMSTCRLSVSSGGNSMYELIFLGLAPLVVAHNEHQAEFAGNAARLGACQFFGTGSEVNWEGLAAAVETQYDQPAKTAPLLIDGLGVRRIVQHLKQLV